MPDSENPTPPPPGRDPEGGSRIDRRSFLLGGTAAAGVAAAGLGVYAVARPRRPDPEETFAEGRPVLFRGATVVTGDPELGTRRDTDVLVEGGRIRAVGREPGPPDDAAVIDARGAVLMPGMVDTHRHMWQTVLRGVGADWTIQNYFRWMYEEWGRHWRPEDVYAGNYLSMVEALDSGVTTSLDWSHGLRTPDHADAAADALFDSGGRARLAYGNIFAPPQEWVVGGDVDRLLEERFSSGDRLVTMQLAWDGGGEDPEFPERPAWEFARDRGLPVTLHAGVWGYPRDVAIRNLHDNGFLLPTNTYVHAASLEEESYRMIADSGGSVSVSAESELNAGQGYPPTGTVRDHGIPLSLSMDTSVWWSGDMFSAMRATLSADRGIDHLEAHEEDSTVVNNDLRTEDVLRYATQGGADALGLGSLIGSVTPGKAADLVLLRADTPSMVPLTNPEHHIVFQAGRAEVDTVMVDGRVVKYEGRLLSDSLDRAARLAEASRDHIREQAGEEEWEQAQEPPEFEVS